MTTLGPQPRFRIYTTWQSYLSVLGDVISGRARHGDDCTRLEEEVARRHDIAHAVCMPKARVGIYLAVEALVRPGRKVVLSPYTLTDVINMVLCAGAIPVFADIERETCNIDPEQIAALIDDKTDAVLVTHLHGLTCDMRRIRAICDERNVSLIEDAAQAFGSRRDDGYAGTFGDAGVYSFGMYKHVNAFFGGMLVTPHADLAATIRERMAAFPWQEIPYFLQKFSVGMASDFATWPPLFRAFTYWVFRFGFLHDIGFLNRQVTVDQNPQTKYELPESYLRRMMPMQARLVRRQLATVDDFIAARIAAARIYHQGFHDLPGVLPPPLLENGSHVYTHYPLQVPDRDALLRYMVRNGRDVAIQHLRSCNEVDCYAAYRRDCPNAKAAAASNILLSSYPRYGIDEVHENVRVIRAFFSNDYSTVTA